MGIDCRFRELQSLGLHVETGTQSPPKPTPPHLFFRPAVNTLEGMQRMRGLHTGRAEELATSTIFRPLCPKELRWSSVSNGHCCQCVWSTLVLCSFHGGLSDAGGDGRRADRSPLPQVATCGLRERTAVAMTTNKAVFV